MDEEDAVWLELINKHRAEEGIAAVTENELELLMDRFEKEAYFEQAKHGNGSNSAQVNIYIKYLHQYDQNLLGRIGVIV